MSGYKAYRNVRLSPTLFSAIDSAFREVVQNWEAAEAVKLEGYEKEQYQRDVPPRLEYSLSVTRNEERWEYETLDSFIDAYTAGADRYNCTFYWRSRIPRYSITAPQLGFGVNVHDEVYFHVEIPKNNVAERRLMRMVDANAELPSNKVAPARVKVFIGHGQANDWRELQADLRDKHNIEVIAFESGAREGHATRDIITGMLNEADFALLVMTAEDEQLDNTLRARQNVIHEAGLFQGKLGYHRAIMLVEEGVENFSNVAGIVYIPFRRGQIRGTVGDILAVLRREGLY